MRSINRRDRPRRPVLAAALLLAVLASACTNAAALTVTTAPTTSAGATFSGSTVSPTADELPATGVPAESSPSAARSSAPTTRSSPSTPAAAARYYVSIGDSYAAGYQASGPDTGDTTRNGFAYQLANRLQTAKHPLTLVNFGCSGSTSAQLVSEVGCKASALGPVGIPYPSTSQGTAALAFLNAHRGAVGLVTVIIGGNDVKPCLTAASPQECMQRAIPIVRRNVVGLVQAIRKVVGSSVPVVGLTYLDAFLGSFLQGDPKSIAVAQYSRVLFQNYLNPALKSAYEGEGASFIDVTSATGAFGADTKTMNLPPYGTIPLPVARVCQLTYYCQYQDVHPRTAGYALIADLVFKAVKE